MNRNPARFLSARGGEEDGAGVGRGGDGDRVVCGAKVNTTLALQGLLAVQRGGSWFHHA